MIMHQACFGQYEGRLVDELAKQARYKQTKYKDIQERLWVDDCYQLVYKHCTCKCNTGCLLKKMSKSRRRGISNSSQDHDSGVSVSPKNSPELGSDLVRITSVLEQLGTDKGSMKEFISTEAGVIMKNLKVKKRGKKNIASIGTVITDTYIDANARPSDITPEELKLRPMRQTNFQHRADFDVLKAILPREKFNSTHIAVESNGYGCDEHRSYILSNLALCGTETLECLICRQALLIYDSFPLIDGLMFQSPESYVDQLTPSEYEPPYFKVNEEPMFIHGICVSCAEQTDILFECRYCSKPWNGKHYQLGNLIKFDVFAAKPCCSQRVTCNNCHQPLGDFNAPRPFSFFSRMEACSRCGYADYHCVKPLSSYRMAPCSVLNTMMSPTKMTPSPKINPNHFPPLGYEEEKRASPESPSQQIQHKQKQEVEKKVKTKKSSKTIGSRCAMDQVSLYSRK